MNGYTLVSDSVTRSYQHIYEKIGCEYRGNWRTFDWLMKYLSGKEYTGIRRDIRLSQEEFLWTYKAVLLRSLESAGEAIMKPFAPWSPKYRHHGPSIGIRSGNYLSAISHLRPVSSRNRVRMTIPSYKGGTKSRTRGLPMARYSLIFEIGSEVNNQPERPLWRGAYEYIGGEKYLRGLIVSKIGSTLGSKDIKIKVR